MNLTVCHWLTPWILRWSIQIKQEEVSVHQHCCISLVQGLFGVDWIHHSCQSCHRLQDEEEEDHQRAHRWNRELSPPGGSNTLWRTQLLWLAGGQTGGVCPWQWEGVRTRDADPTSSVHQQRWWELNTQAVKPYLHDGWKPQSVVASSRYLKFITGQMISLVCWYDTAVGGGHCWDCMQTCIVAHLNAGALVIQY